MIRPDPNVVLSAHARQALASACAHGSIGRQYTMLMSPETEVHHTVRRWQNADTPLLGCVRPASVVSTAIASQAIGCAMLGWKCHRHGVGAGLGTAHVHVGDAIQIVVISSSLLGMIAIGRGWRSCSRAIGVWLWGAAGNWLRQVCALYCSPCPGQTRHAWDAPRPRTMQRTA